MNYKQWLFPNVDKQMVSEVADDCGLDPLIVFIAFARGLTDPYEIEQFVAKEPDFCDPSEYSGINEAVDRINIALESQEKILVFGDYDCDGVTATALLVKYLKSRGADVDFYVPDRENDGYGISEKAVKQAAGDGYTLIITVDNGITAVNEVDLANNLGIDMVITDHHLPQGELPDAVAVVDPHIDGEWIFSDLCGVGVAFKLICALDERSCEEMLYEYGDLVTLGTIADIVPLIGENRVIVDVGLKLINRRSNPGVRALIEAACVKYATAGNVAFSICPRINAAGRMASAQTAVKLFLTDSYEEAQYYAGCLDSYNTERQSKEQDVFDSACEIIENNGYTCDRVLVVDGYGWHVGIIGIVASKLVEKYGKPAIVISKGGEVSVGSGRSISGFSLFDAISSCSGLLTKFGGHELAAGLSILEKDIDDFRKEINQYAVNKPLVFPKINVDCRIKPRALNVDVAKSLKAFEPYGAGNPTPIFAVTDCTLLSVAELSGGKHIRLKLRKENQDFWTVKFGMCKADLPYMIGDTIDIAVTLDVNVYNNLENVSIIIKAMRGSNINDGEMILQLNALNKFDFNCFDSSDAAAISPTRDDIASVFRTIKVKGNISLEQLENQLCGKIAIGKIDIAIRALSELNIISSKNGILSLTSFSGKADLESAPVLRKIKSEFREVGQHDK